MLIDKKSRLEVQELVCTFSSTLNLPCKEKALTYFPLMKWVEVKVFLNLCIYLTEHLLLSQIKGIEEQQNNLPSPIKHICTLSYAYCLSL